MIKNFDIINILPEGHKKKTGNNIEQFTGLNNNNTQFKFLTYC